MSLPPNFGRAVDLSSLGKPKAEPAGPMPGIEITPENLTGRIEEAQFFHEVLEHRWYLSEREGHDVGLTFAAQSYIDDVLPFRRDSGVEMGQSK